MNTIVLSLLKMLISKVPHLPFRLPWGNLQKKRRQQEEKEGRDLMQKQSTTRIQAFTTLFEMGAQPYQYVLFIKYIYSPHK